MQLEVTDTYALDLEQPVFTVRGRLIGGTARVGMTLRTSGGRAAPISRVAPAPGRSTVAVDLVLRLSDRSELDAWQLDVVTGAIATIE